MLGLLSRCRNLPVDFLVYAHIKEEITPRFEDKREEYFRLNNRKKKWTIELDATRPQLK